MRLMSNSFLASHDFFRLLITFANHLDPEQGQQIDSLYLDPNCLTLIVFLKEFFEKKWFWKKVSKRQQKHEKWPSMQIFNERILVMNYYLRGKSPWVFYSLSLRILAPPSNNLCQQIHPETEHGPHLSHTAPQGQYSPTVESPVTIPNEPLHVISNNCGILTSADSDEPVQPPFKLRNSKLCSVSSITLIEYSSD